MKKVFSAVLVFAALYVIVAVWTLRNFKSAVRSEVVTQLSEKTGRISSCF